MPSNEYFRLDADKRRGIGFRWLSSAGDGKGPERIPLSDSVCSIGIVHTSKAKAAAREFLRWFFRADTQEALLNSSRTMGRLPAVFGIAGGFSSLKQVASQVFPKYYPGLLGMCPPDEVLQAPNVLPQNWPGLKEKVIVPWLYAAVHAAPTEGQAPLSEQIALWLRVNK
jgi:ABC-type glycerol-3-phosphate transport system substrate-binding protein